MRPERPRGDPKLLGAGRVNRLYAVLSKVNEAIVRVREPQQLFQAACRIAVEDGQLLLAWIGFVEPETQRIRPAAQFGRDEGYLSTVSISLDQDAPEGRGPTGIALREGRPFINNDTENNPVMRPWRDEQLKRGFRSSASFPLKAEGTTAGVLTLYAGEPGYFDEEEVRLLVCLADDFSFALDASETARQRALAEESLRRSHHDLEARVAERTAELRTMVEERELRVRLAEALGEIDDNLHSSLDRDEVMRRAIADGCEALGASTGALSLYKDHAFTVAHAHGFADDLEGLVIPEEREHHSMLALEAQQTVVVEDATSDERVDSQHLLSFGIVAVIVVPLIVGGEAIGALYYNFDRPHRFRDTEVDFARKLGASLALALENAHLFEAERIGREREAALKGVAQLSSVSLRPDELASQVMARIAALFEPKQAQIRLVSEDGAALESAGVTDPEGHIQELGDMPVDADTETAAVFRTGEFRVGSDIGASVSAQSRRNATLSRIRAYVLLPLVVADRAIGTLYMGWEEHKQFSPDDMSFLQAVAAQLATGLQNARLSDERARQGEYARALNDINDIVHATLDFDEIMDRAVVQITSAMGVDATAVHVPEDGGWEFRYWAGLPDTMRDQRMTDAEASVSTRVRETREPFLSNDLEHDLRTNPEITHRLGTRALLAVPLIVRGEVLAVLIAWYFGESARFTKEQVDFARKASTTLALALENARLYQAQQGIAERLQSALLEMPASIPGVEFSYAYHAAAESSHVGGDFYDIFEIDEHRVGVTIGDVAGKGLDAAVLTSLAKNTIRAHAVEDGKGPSRVLELTNEVVYRGTPVESFVTVYFGVLDRRDGTLVYSNAGHPSCAVVRAGGGVTGLGPTGPIVGAFPDMEFGEAELRLEPDDLLFLYTDGLTEARLDQVKVAEERLFERLGSRCGSTATDVIADIVDYAMSLTGFSLRDDLALLALKLAAPGASSAGEQPPGL